MEQGIQLASKHTETLLRNTRLTLRLNVQIRREMRCSPFFGPEFSVLKVDRCLQYIVDRSLLLGLWEL